MKHANYKRLGVMMALSCMLAACNEPQTFVATNTDRFKNDSYEHYEQASKVLRADYAFVLDYGYSVQDKVPNITDAITNFFDDLRNKNIDYRVGFIRGAIHGTAGNQNIQSWTPSDFMAPYLIPTSSVLLQSAVLSSVGQPLSQNTPVLLEAGRKALTAQAVNFIRPEAQLVLVFVSDGDDKSQNYASAYGVPATIPYYVNAYKNLKSHPSYVSARAVIITGNSECEVDPDNHSEAVGNRLADVTELIEAASAHPQAPADPIHCIKEPFNLALSDMAEDVTRLTERFRLQASPLTGSLRVSVGGVEKTSGEWSFNSGSNEVVFATGHIPQADDSVDFHYEIPFVLYRTPKVNCLKATVNGANVAKDNTNGWSYIEAENRIVFNGSSKPADDADIRITYEVR